MAELSYPSAKFVKCAIELIQSGKRIDIKVASNREKKLLSALLPNLIDASKNGIGINKTSWQYVIGMFFALRFITVFFYAKSGGYSTSFAIKDNYLLITMSPRSSD